MGCLVRLLQALREWGVVLSSITLSGALECVCV
jgi:hypothetical protein